MQQFNPVTDKQIMPYFDSQTPLTFGFTDRVSQDLFLIA